MAMLAANWPDERPASWVIISNQIGNPKGMK